MENHYLHTANTHIITIITLASMNVVNRQILDIIIISNFWSYLLLVQWLSGSIPSRSRCLCCRRAQINSVTSTPMSIAPTTPPRITYSVSSSRLRRSYLVKSPSTPTPLPGPPLLPSTLACWSGEVGGIEWLELTFNGGEEVRAGTGQLSVPTHTVTAIITARCTIVQSAVLGSHDVCPSVRDVGELWSHRLEILETKCTDN